MYEVLVNNITYEILSAQLDNKQLKVKYTIKRESKPVTFSPLMPTYEAKCW